MLKLASISRVLVSAFVLSSCAVPAEPDEILESTSTMDQEVSYGCASDGGFRCMCGERFMGCFTSILACELACGLEEELE